MPDKPISQLTPKYLPFASSFTNPTTGALLEVLDQPDTTMASTGTNKAVAPGDLLMGFLAQGTGVTLTETAGIVTIAASGGGGGMTVGSAVSGGSNHATLVEDGSGNLAALAIGSTGNVLTVVSGAPAWSPPVTSNGGGSPLFAAASFSGNLHTLIQSGTTPASVGVSLTLPTAGTYLISSNMFGIINFTGSAGQYGEIFAQLYDTTNSNVIPNTPQAILFLMQQATVVSTVSTQQSGVLGPAFYTVTGSTVIDLQGCYEVSGGSAAAYFGSGGITGFGNTTLSAVRIS